MGNENVIEFNGKRYDAITGELLGKSHAEVAEPLAPPKVARRTIDGVVRKKPAHQHTQDSFEKTKITVSAPVKIRTKPAHQAGRILKPHRPEPTKTLMRRAVHKPATTIKPAIKPQSPAEVMAKPMSAIAVKHSVHHVDPLRKHRATQTPKSHAVRRFAAGSAHPHIALPVHQKPAVEQVIRPQPSPLAKPDIFEAAIAHANSHEQPALKHPSRKHHKKRKIALMITGFVALLTLGGFLTYLNMSAIELKIASINAGFSAQLPAYSPTGYELTDIKNRPGQITLHFRSGDRTYQVTQQPTDWNSQTLGDSIIADASSQPLQVNGRTVYVYEGIASWVSGGVRYDITGNANFSADELAAIAGSM